MVSNNNERVCYWSHQCSSGKCDSCESYDDLWEEDTSYYEELLRQRV